MRSKHAHAQSRSGRKNKKLRVSLSERKQVLAAIRRGEVDALVDLKDDKREIFTLQTADTAYRLSLILRAMTDGAVITTDKGLILYANNRFAEMVNVPLPNVIGSQFPDFVVPSDRNRFQTIFKNALRESSHGEINLDTRKRAPAVAQLALSTFLTRKTQYVSILAADITERKQMEKMRDEFIADATDELLTPLVSIKGYLDAILREKDVSLPSEVASNLEVVRRNVDRLHEIVDDLVDIRRMLSDRFQLNLDALDLREVMENCVAEAKPLLGEKHSLHLEVPERPLPIRGDRVKLSLVVGSLLNNAAKFTPQGGEMIIRASEEADMVQVQVSDLGIGIKQEDLGRVFEPFPAIQKTEYVKGKGLALSTSKGIIEAHGGKIWAESPGEGKGTTFTFTLPKRKEVS